MRARSAALDLALLAIVRLFASGVVLGAGFDALSDDDYARTFIAERFAHAPSLDPSGTSWLPLPFWLVGSTMAVFGSTLGVARGAALVGGVFATWCVYVAAGWLGARRRGQIAAGFLASCAPYLAHLGAAMVPELPTAALMLIGVAALARPAGASASGGAHGPGWVATLPAGEQPPSEDLAEASRHWIGAAALFLACFCRYEAWPAAVAFAAVVAWDALHRRRLDSIAEMARAAASPIAWRIGLALPALLALGAPLLWLLHGIVRHGDALFFAESVASYQRALGDAAPVRVGTYLLALAREPLVFIPAVVLAVGVALHDRATLSGMARPALMLAAVLLGLEVGAIAGGAPTHHPERAVVAFWLFGCGATGALLDQVRWGRSATALGVGLACVSVGAAMFLGRPEGTVERSREREIGALARAHLPSDGWLVVETPDYGYFAVIAAFGDPARALPVTRGDPREPDGALKSLVELRALTPPWAASAWLAAPPSRLADLEIRDILAISGGEFALGELRIHE